MKESDIERAVCKYAESVGMLSYKFTSPGKVGVPDRMFIYNGTVFFIEFKASGKKPTPWQIREHQRLMGQNIFVSVADSVEIGKDVVDVVKRNIDAISANVGEVQEEIL